jgi:hypothetical protein
VSSLRGEVAEVEIFKVKIPPPLIGENGRFFEYIS